MSAMKKVLIVLGVILVVGGLWLLYVWFALGNDSESNSNTPITNFEECIQAGNPIMESFPRQCAANGQTFVEDIDETQTEEENSGDTNAANDNTYTSESGMTLIVNVDENQTITSPFTFDGEVPGNWSFEGTFPIEIQDSVGETIAESYGQLQGDWMTTDQVPFQATIEFEDPSTDTGFLVLHKANASGLAEQEDNITIPVQFSAN